MKIGIIGAGISGLTAGWALAKAGHQVMIYEQSGVPGGRMASVKAPAEHRCAIDYGLPCLDIKPSDGNTYSSWISHFMEELIEKKVIREWTGDVLRYDNGIIKPEEQEKRLFIAPEGMSAIAAYLARKVDIRYGEKISGLTRIASTSTKKSSWMINSSRIDVFPADAVIIAGSAIQAYGLVSTAQDELPLRKMIALLDDIPYSSCCSLLAGFPIEHKPDWNVLKCNHDVISLISNESSKRDTGEECVMAVQTTSAYSKKMQADFDDAQNKKEIENALAEILGTWAGNPNWSETHHWKHKGPLKKLDRNKIKSNTMYLESDDKNAPLAVIGDFFLNDSFRGSPFEAAMVSGFLLGRSWTERFSKN